MVQSSGNPLIFLYSMKTVVCRRGNMAPHLVLYKCHLQEQRFTKCCSSKNLHRDESEKCLGEHAQSQGTCSNISFLCPSRPTVTSYLVFVVCREIFGGTWYMAEQLMEKSCCSRFPHAVLSVCALPLLFIIVFLLNLIM